MCHTACPMASLPNAAMCAVAQPAFCPLSELPPHNPPPVADQINTVFRDAMRPCCAIMCALPIYDMCIAHV